jgi:hypothetical protein
MARYLRVRCIVKTGRAGAHERINAICGLTPDGSHWTLTHEDAVLQVENGNCRFYIERPRSLSGIDFVAREINKLRTEVSLQVIDSSSKICSLRHPPREQRYDVIVAMDVCGHKYLKTGPDRDQPDQLLFLPACPHPAHTPYSVPGPTELGAALDRQEVAEEPGYRALPL